MKVLELIERLREFDPQLEIEVWSPVFGNDTRDITDLDDDGQGTLVIEVE
jgi:hypothetical protein